MISMADALTERMRVKNRILGLLLRDARESAGRTVEECARLLGIEPDTFRAYESGKQAPGLPELEVLAYFFRVPIAHFFGAEKTLQARQEEEKLVERVPEMINLRHRIIGIKLAQMRGEAGMTIEEAAERTGLPADLIAGVEQGRRRISVNELETLAYGVRGSLDDLLDEHGTVGGWLRDHATYERFKKLPPEIRDFVLKPINHSYIELAMRLSRMDVEKLRTIAESILEITY